MGVNEVKKMKEKMTKGSEKTLVPPGGGQVAGDAKDSERPADRSTEMRQTGGLPSGQKSISEKQAISEELIAEAKAKDVQDSREETSEKGTRHDMIVPFPPNIPPTIQQERMKMGQHPISGEPWTSQERKQWEREQEDARVQHAAAVRESEERMRQDTAMPTPIQPITHVPSAFLTAEQKAAMQREQDEGASPARQAQARDAMHPDLVGRRQAEERMAMNEGNKTAPEMDEDLEREEVEGTEEETAAEEPDADEVQKQLDEARTKH